MPEDNDLEAKHNALDALFTETTGEKPSPDSGPAVSVAAPTLEPEGDDPKPDPAPNEPIKPAASKPAAPAAPRLEKSDKPALDIKVKPASGLPASAPAAAAAPAAPVAPAPPAAPVDALDTVELPPYSKPKSVEAFAKVKELARAAITTKEAEITRLQAEVAQREEKLKGVLPPEAAKELEELRTFRRSVDIENDPDFKKHFDGKVESNNNSIFAKMAEAGVTKEQLAEIHRLGGVDGVDWEVILPRLPAATRRFIEAKLVANEELKEGRKMAVEQARKDPNVFEQQRVHNQSKEIIETANGYLAGLAWTAEKPIPPNATPEEKAKLEADNAFAKETQDRLKTTLKDFTPARFAEMVVGTTMAFKFRREVEELTKEKAAVDANLLAMTKERDDARAELEKIKRAGQTHRRTSTTPPAQPKSQFENGASALDRLHSEITAA